MYLEMRGKWNLRPLAGISTAPVFSADGSIRIAEGYDRDTGLWCANVPDLQIPEHPTRDDAVAAFRLLRRPSGPSRLPMRRGVVIRTSALRW